MAYFFPPLGGGGTQRTVKLVRYLEPAGVRIERQQGERRAGAFQALRKIQSWIALPDGYAGWARAARHASDARIVAGGIDAIWTTSSPESAHLAGLALRRRRGVPWVADFRDPWVGRLTYRPPTPWHDRTLRRMERLVIEGADRVTMVSEALVETYRARYTGVPREKFVCLPNGVDSDDWRRVERAGGAIPSEPEDRGRFVLLHTGQLAPRP